MNDVDDMECPYCGSEDICLDTNVSEVWYEGVNEADGTYRYICDECGKEFYIYEKTEAVKRKVMKELE